MLKLQFILYFSITTMVLCIHSNLAHSKELNFENPTCGAFSSAQSQASGGGLAALPAVTEMMFYVGFAQGFIKARGIEIETDKLRPNDGKLCEGLPENTPLEDALEQLISEKQ